jgi:outer membrane protein assembly factor BamE (lipoprotein component of BamABCDE complex)
MGRAYNPAKHGNPVKNMRHGKKTLSMAVLAAMLAVSACVSHEDRRGYAIEFAKLEDVKPGSSTRDDVFAALGSPSTTSGFGQEKWYYTSPELAGQETITVTFRPDGVVQSVEKGQGEASRDIAFARDKTRTEGNSITVMQQLLGNLGRFNAAGAANKGQNKVHTPQPGM